MIPWEFIFINDMIVYIIKNQKCSFILDAQVTHMLLPIHIFIWLLLYYVIVSLVFTNTQNISSIIEHMLQYKNLLFLWLNFKQISSYYFKQNYHYLVLIQCLLHVWHYFIKNQIDWNRIHQKYFDLFKFDCYITCELKILQYIYCNYHVKTIFIYFFSKENSSKTHLILPHGWFIVTRLVFIFYMLCPFGTWIIMVLYNFLFLVALNDV